TPTAIAYARTVIHEVPTGAQTAHA
ncbi:MAG: hypothetical protein QOG22_2943, partial [Pseudonocardiales bacterium]|nr:hypothetical protein [Pseudonocardiales bacterium]